MEKNGVIETRTERRTVITRDGENVDHDKVISNFYHLTNKHYFHFCDVLQY